MKMYLISDNVDTYTGMRLAGVDGIVVHEQDELKQCVGKKCFHEPTVGIVLLTENSVRNFRISSTHSDWNVRCRFLWKFRTGTERDEKRISLHLT